MPYFAKLQERAEVSMSFDYLVLFGLLFKQDLKGPTYEANKS